MSVIDVTTAAATGTVPPVAYETIAQEDDDGCYDCDQRRRCRRHHLRRSSATAATSVGSRGPTFVDIERGSWPPDTAANSVTDRTPLLLNRQNSDDVEYSDSRRNVCVVQG